VTKSSETVVQAMRLIANGETFSYVSRSTGVSRSTIRCWANDPDAAFRRPLIHAAGEACPAIEKLPKREYAYLLGQYLGDGCISAMGPRGVFRLRIATCDAYPDIRQQTIDAMAAVLPNKVGVIPSVGCSEVASYSKHWPCLFPQHGPGRKHERKIELVDWQLRIVELFAHEFLTGLVHSDGCRSTNTIKKKGKVYEYPRYFFTNVSPDILNLFGATCEMLGISWRYNRSNSISIAERDSVTILDSFIGPKT
jgi:hypothetical protein